MKTIVCALALATASAAIWGATAIFARTPTSPHAAMVSSASSISVMQMMKDAKNLPEEKFDTH
jgi:hypothetical protein